jgi:hypothetical protein
MLNELISQSQKDKYRLSIPYPKCLEPKMFQISVLWILEQTITGTSLIPKSEIHNILKSETLSTAGAQKIQIL